MYCPHFEAGTCRSCRLIEMPYPLQLSRAQDRDEGLLAGTGIAWLEPFPSAERGFRNRAKMVVGGRTGAVTLGLLSPDGEGVDLSDCALYPPAMQDLFPLIKGWIDAVRMEPYNLTTRRGELKNVLVTLSPDGEAMVRFVCRSTADLARMRSRLPLLLEAVPALRVVTVNVLPEHRAVVEGEREIVLTEQETLTMRVNGIPLRLRPQGFFQTNTAVASELYRLAGAWCDDAAPSRVWDLFCGVGGFAFHCARPDRGVVGIEVSEQAIAAARLTRDELGYTPDQLDFRSGDAAGFALEGEAAPDLVIVNPPRRGIGQELAAWLDASGIGTVLYSSCNAESLAKDLLAMPHLRPRRGRLLDMFPHTAHVETLVELVRA